MSETTLVSGGTISPFQAMYHELYSLLELWKFTAPGGAYAGYTGGFFKLELGGGGTRNALAFNIGASAWDSSTTAIDFGSIGAVRSDSSAVSLIYNSFYNGTNYKAKATGLGAIINIISGELFYTIAPSVSAGSNQTYINAWKTDVNGNFLIGATPSTSAPNPGISMLTAGGIIVGNNSGLNGHNFVQFMRSGVAIGTIQQSGTTSVNYNTTSDYRLKTVVGPLNTSGAFIDALRPVVGHWRSDGSPFVGFIAHEVQAVSPSSVTGAKDATDSDGNPIHQQMAYASAEIIANLVAEVKALRTRIATLEAGQ